MALIFAKGFKIAYAHTSFKWANLASHNAGVTVVIVGISREIVQRPKLFSNNENGETISKEGININAYLVQGADVIVNPLQIATCGQSRMVWGNKPTDGGHLLLEPSEIGDLGLSEHQQKKFIRRFFGSAEFIRGTNRFCIWIEDDDLDEALAIDSIRNRIMGVRKCD